MGINFDVEYEDNGLTISDGAVFSLQPNTNNINNNEIIIGQITLQNDISKTMTINVRGKINDVHNTWAENNIIYNLQKPPSREINIPTNCEIWFDGCNSCLVNNNLLNVCTELECSEIKNPIVYAISISINYSYIPHSLSNLIHLHDQHVYYHINLLSLR